MSFLFKPKTKNGNFIQLPQIFDKLLICNGAWPTDSVANDFSSQLKGKLYEVYGWIVFLNMAYISLCEVSYLIANMMDIYKAVQSFAPAMTGMFAAIRSLHFKLKIEELKELLKFFADEIWIDGEKHSLRVRRCHRVMWPAFIFFLLLLFVLIFYYVVPIYIFYSTNQTMASTDKRTPYYMIFPYDEQKVLPYFATYISAVFAGYTIVTNFYAHDALLLLFVSYLCGQFEMLHGDLLRLIPECHLEWKERYAVRVDNGDMFGSFHFDAKPTDGRMKVLQDMYTKRLHILSARHNDLIRFCVQLNDLISFPILVNIVNSTFLICFCGFQFLISADTTFYAYMCNWEGGQLSKVSPLLLRPKDMDVELLNTKLPLWKSIKYYPAGKDFCNKLRFMIMRSQRPVELNAMKFTILSLEGFTKVLSSSMSYFALLKTFLDKQK